MTRITNEEISILKYQVGQQSEQLEMNSAEENLPERLLATLDRLAELEARNEVLESAVAFKGFDVLPVFQSKIFDDIEEGEVYIQVKKSDGEVMDNWVYQDMGYENVMSDNSPMTSEEMVVNEKYIGWRYPVGDLS